MNEYPFDVEKLIQICQENGVVEIRLFGSMARGESNSDSDIDLLVEFAHPISLFQMAHLQSLLSEALGRTVNLVTRRGLSGYMHDEMMREAILLFPVSPSNSSASNPNETSPCE